MRKYLLAIVLAALAGSAHAQVVQAWSHLYDGPAMHYDLAYRVVVGPDGSAYVTGISTTTAGPPKSYDIQTFAYDRAGNLLWSARYDSPGGFDDIGVGIALSPQGDVYVAGRTQHSSPGLYTSRAVLIKYSSNGTQLFAREYGDPLGQSDAGGLRVDAQGDVFVSGGEWSTNGTVDMGVRKLDSAGNELWVATFDGSHHGNDYAGEIALAPNGDILVAGQANTPAFDNADWLVMRVSSAGNVLWGSQVDPAGGLGDYAFDVAVDALGNAYVAGKFDMPAPSFQNQGLLAYDPAGNLSWMKNIDGGSGGSDAFVRVAVDPFGRVVTAGSIANSSGLGYSDIDVCVYDTAGNLVWERTWDGPAHRDDFANDFDIDAIGNIHVAATIVGAANASSAVALEVDPEGQLRYMHVRPPTVAGTSGDYYLDVATGPDGSLTLVGFVDGGVSSDLDYLVVHLDRTAIPFCFGDGSGTACPCGNLSPAIAQSGCASSFGLGGRLIDSGASSLSADTLVLNGTNMTQSSALYFQGTASVAGGAGSVFGDGLRCAGGTTVRLGTKQNTSGSSQYPTLGDPSVSQRGGVSAPGDRTYQVWYRNAAAFCTSATFNLTNGLRVTWYP